MKNYVMSALCLIFYFLPQIYNEQIGDLLDPTQRNLEVGTSYALSCSFIVLLWDYFDACLIASCCR